MLVYSNERSPEEWATSRSPFKLPLMGYELWEQSDNGSWYSMLQPDASGYGIFTSSVLTLSDCNRYYQTLAQEVIGNHIPWFLPTLVKWVSPYTIDEDNNVVLVDNLSEFQMEYPIVGIELVETPMSSERFLLDNIHIESEWDRDFRYEQIKFNDHLINGVAPLWHVLPVRQEFVDGFIQAMRSIDNTFHTNLFYFNCECMLENIHSENCAYEIDFRSDCDCDEIEGLVGTIINLYETQPTLTQFMDETTATIWERAIEQTVNGWEVIHQHAEKEHEWAYYSWLHQSPFLDSPGQSLKAHRESTGLTNLETHQAS